MAIALWEDGGSPFEGVFAAEEESGIVVTVLDSEGALLSRQLHRGIHAPDLPPRIVVRMDFTKDPDGDL